MTATTVDTSAGTGSTNHQTRERLVADPTVWVSASVIVLMVLGALLAGVITTYAPDAVSYDLFSPPSAGHWFGTDNVGKDVFANVVFGARVSLIVGFASSVAALLVGVLVGAYSGYFGGIVDILLMRVAEFCQAIPGFVVAIVIVAILGPSLQLIVGVIAFTMWPQTARVVRGQYLSWREREFVEASKSLGLSDARIMFREILPNAIPPALVVATMSIGRAVLLEAGLSFLGLGDPARASWGEMLQRAQPYLASAWWMSVFPGSGIFLLVLSVNMFGDSMNGALNPTKRV